MIIKSKGFFVIEAMIAVLIFMIGILGVLQTQVASMEATTDAQYRVQASYMAQNIVSKAILNKSSIGTYIDGSNAEYGEWLDELGRMLPGVANSPPELTTFVDGGNTFINVKINWKRPTSDVISTYEYQTIVF